eukprot:TRINITY_DN30095_c0_g1_i1.p1 TRINITY_DN30095_c0_g1~~TRINITY_DN30095_c0_g1_i1.p1  ORF type:complete len:523 (-),score=122.84 TRINITY_DN30095_c0_g1_i1:93-1661(-)
MAAYAASPSGSEASPPPPRRSRGFSLHSAAALVSNPGAGIPPSAAAVISASRPAGKEKRPSAALPDAEQRAECQLQHCRILAQAVGKVSEVLLGAGMSLQRRDSKSSGPGPSGVEQSGMPASESSRPHFDAAALSLMEEPEVSQAVNGFFTVCGGLGAELVGLAGVLTGDAMSPLQELQRTYKVEKERRKQELAKLDQYEALCCGALVESAQRKEKASAELQGMLQDRDKKKKGIGVKWLKKAAFGNTKSETKLQHAAHAQTAAVEDFASRADQIECVQLRRDQAIQETQEALAQVCGQRRQVVNAALDRCAACWDLIAEAFRQAATQLRRESEVLSVDEAAPPHGAVSADRSPIDARASSKASLSVETRARIPRLSLEMIHAKAMCDPDQYAVSSVASSSGYSSGSGSPTSATGRSDDTPAARSGQDELRYSATEVSSRSLKQADGQARLPSQSGEVSLPADSGSVAESGGAGHDRDTQFPFVTTATGPLKAACPPEDPEPAEDAAAEGVDPERSAPPAAS